MQHGLDGSARGVSIGPTRRTMEPACDTGSPVRLYPLAPGEGPAGSPALGEPVPSQLIDRPPLRPGYCYCRHCDGTGMYDDLSPCIDCDGDGLVELPAGP